MKPKVVIVILAVVCAGLAIALFAAKKQNEEQHIAAENSIMEFSNQVVNASLKINDLNQVNLALTNDLATSRQQTADLSTKLDDTTATLAARKSDLESAQNQIAGLTSQISDLEVQNKSLEQRTGELSNNIIELDQQIVVTREKLAKSESGNAFLQQELQRQMAQRAELEHKFSDLDDLRQQVKKIKNDMFVARRLRLMQNSGRDKKGAELLVHPNVPAPEIGSEAAAFNGLNVEIGSDGSVRVIPPIAAPTNSAAH